MGIKEAHTDADPLPAELPTTRIVNDLPVFREEEPEPPITVVTRPAPRAAPDTRALPEQVYEDEYRALQKRLQSEQRHHDRLIEKVARKQATAADLAQSRAQLRATKDALEDAASLHEHARIVARERAERARVDRYYAAVDRTEADFTALVESADTMERLVADLGAARERFQTLLEGGLVDLCGEAAKTRDDPQRRVLEAITSATSQANGIDLHLLRRLRVVRALRDLNVGPTTEDDRLEVWAQAWTRRAIEIARERGPAVPAPDPESTDGAA